MFQNIEKTRTMQIVANIHHGKCIESFGLPAHGILAYYLQTFGHITCWMMPKVVLRSHKSDEFRTHLQRENMNISQQLKLTSDFIRIQMYKSSVLFE